MLGGTDGGYWDLNRGAGGHFIFRGYTTTTDKTQAVTDIQFNMPQRNSTGQVGDETLPWNEFAQDLNERASGNWIYLRHQRVDA